jgi:hypothetical protein
MKRTAAGAGRSITPQRLIVRSTEVSAVQFHNPRLIGKTELLVRLKAGYDNSRCLPTPSSMKISPNHPRLLAFLCALAVSIAPNANAQGGASNADLAALSLSAGTLNPEFAPGTTGYAASVANAVSSITVTASPFSGSATIQVRVNGGSFTSIGDGVPSPGLPLDVGPNSIEVRVTSGNLSTIKTYTVVVTRNLPQPPDVQTLPASVTGTTATLNGTANPQGLPTSVWFEWGATTSYGTTTPEQAVGSGLVNTNFNQVLTGLLATQYHFRSVASNSIGTTYGANQTFTPPLFTPAQANLTPIEFGTVAWGDSDNDGRLDLLLSGCLSEGITAVTECWTNTGSGFSNRFVSLIGLEYSSVAWSDFNNDDWLDAAYVGNYTAGGGIWRAQVASNNLSGFVTRGDASFGLPQPYYGTVAWGDYDNDGRPDLLFAGIVPGQGASQICRNTGSGFTNIYAGLPQTSHSSGAWGDYDNDGRLDLVITGTGGMAQIWRNTGQGFTNSGFTLPRVSYGSVAWGDYDNDGLLDLLFSGVDTTSGTTLCQVWRNTGGGFADVNAGLPGIAYGTAAWGDYDNDGRLDILLCGSPNYIAPATGICQVWRNTGSSFTNVNAGLPGIFHGAAMTTTAGSTSRCAAPTQPTAASRRSGTTTPRRQTPLPMRPPGSKWCSAASLPHSCGMLRSMPKRRRPASVTTSASAPRPAVPTSSPPWRPQAANVACPNSAIVRCSTPTP